MIWDDANQDVSTLPAGSLSIASRQLLELMKLRRWTRESEEFNRALSLHQALIYAMSYQVSLPGPAFLGTGMNSIDERFDKLKQAQIEFHEKMANEFMERGGWDRVAQGFAWLRNLPPA